MDNNIIPQIPTGKCTLKNKEMLGNSLYCEEYKQTDQGILICVCMTCKYWERDSTLEDK